MKDNNHTMRYFLAFMILLLAVAVQFFQSHVGSVPTAYAQSARFDYVTIVSPLFLHKGESGLLLLDRRNGNVWFMPGANGSYQAPVFVSRIPFETLDRQP